MKYFIEVFAYQVGDFGLHRYQWKKMRPTNSTPYEFESVSAARDTAHRCYPDHPGSVRVVDETGAVQS